MLLHGRLQTILIYAIRELYFQGCKGLDLLYVSVFFVLHSNSAFSVRCNVSVFDPKATAVIKTQNVFN